MNTFTRTLVAASVVLAIAVTPAMADVPHIFRPGDIISSGQINENFAAMPTAEQIVQALLADNRFVDRVAVSVADQLAADDDFVDRVAQIPSVAADMAGALGASVAFRDDVAGELAALAEVAFDARYITGHVVMHVGGPDGFATLGDALADLQTRRIAAEGSVVVEIAPGQYFEDTLEFRHPDGDRIEVRGADVDGVRPTLSFEGDGIVVDGHSLGRLQGVRLEQSAGREGGSGIVVRNGGMIRLGPETVHILGFVDEGLLAESGGRAVASDGEACEVDDAFEDHVVAIRGRSNARRPLVVENVAGVGILARAGALVRVPHARIDGISMLGLHAIGADIIAPCAHVRQVDPVREDRTGVRAELGAFVQVTGAVVEGWDQGLVSHGGSTLDASLATAENNEFGFYASSMAYTRATESWSRGNRYNYAAWMKSLVGARQSVTWRPTEWDASAGSYSMVDLVASTCDEGDEQDQGSFTISDHSSVLLHNVHGCRGPELCTPRPNGLVMCDERETRPE